jgi:hypothetical protein
MNAMSVPSAMGQASDLEGNGLMGGCQAGYGERIKIKNFDGGEKRSF